MNKNKKIRIKLENVFFYFGKTYYYDEEKNIFYKLEKKRSENK